MLPGATDENILVMAHTDAFFEGALDNASGIAMMLEIARHYAAIPQAQRRRTITFLTTPDHHHGSVGVTWVHDHFDFTQDRGDRELRASVADAAVSAQRAAS